MKPKPSSPEFLRRSSFQSEWFESLVRRARSQGIAVPDNLAAPIDYGHRPGTYWSPGVAAGAEPRPVGQRLAGLELLRAAEPVPEPKTSLPPDMAELLAAFTKLSQHSFRDDRYLPSLRSGEIEIARLTLASTTRDVISIRARPRGKRIAYCVVDEHDTHYVIAPSSSAEPLTLQQLIDLIESAEGELGFLGLRMLKSKAAGGRMGPGEYRDFIAFSSDFYPELAVHYWFAVRDWIHNEKQHNQA